MPGHGYPGLGAWLAFEDESGQGFRPPRGRAWSRCGHALVVRATGVVVKTVGVEFGPLLSDNGATWPGTAVLGPGPQRPGPRKAQAGLACR
jgi:hypothetical protein